MDKLYTIKNGSLWRHYSEDPTSLRGNFYNVNTPSSITFILNPQVTNSKTFKTISYEGSNGWQVDSIVSDSTGEDQINSTTYQSDNDLAALIYSYTQGAYDMLGNEYPNQLTAPVLYAGFARKENKYVANLINNSAATQGEIVFGTSISGIKGYYSTVTMSTDKVTNEGGEKELFSVGSSYTMNSGY